jgi:hypothetical protein
MSEKVPEAGPEFEVMMREIDAKFIKDGIPISARPLQAVMAVGTHYKITIPLSRPFPGAPPELQRYAQLGEDINDGFERLYGDRLKVDFSVGQMVVLIDGDLYPLRFPRIFGQVRFILSRQFIKAPEISSRGPATCNIVQLVTDLTPVKAATLSDAALRSLDDDFGLGLRALDALEASQDQELIRIARGDIQTAVNNLLDRANRFGESKWSSLQTAEKILKAAITLEGAEFKYGHCLAKLRRQLDTLGVRFDWEPLTTAIQCTPGIRYGQEKCTRDDALAAHHASLRLVLALLSGGAKFERGLA